MGIYLILKWLIIINILILKNTKDQQKFILRKLTEFFLNKCYLVWPQYAKYCPRTPPLWYRRTPPNRYDHTSIKKVYYSLDAILSTDISLVSLNVYGSFSSINTIEVAISFMDHNMETICLKFNIDRYLIENNKYDVKPIIENIIHNIYSSKLNFMINKVFNNYQPY